MKFKCTQTDCFGCRARKCELLKAPVTKRPCPFHKTEEQLEKERQETTERLTTLGRKDLIRKYTANIQDYAI